MTMEFPDEDWVIKELPSDQTVTFPEGLQKIFWRTTDMGQRDPTIRTQKINGMSFLVVEDVPIGSEYEHDVISYMTCKGDKAYSLSFVTDQDCSEKEKRLYLKIVRSFRVLN